MVAPSATPANRFARSVRWLAFVHQLTWQIEWGFRVHASALGRKHRRNAQHHILRHLAQPDFARHTSRQCGHIRFANVDIYTREPATPCTQYPPRTDMRNRQNRYSSTQRHHCRARLRRNHLLLAFNRSFREDHQRLSLMQADQGFLQRAPVALPTRNRNLSRPLANLTNERPAKNLRLREKPHT